MNFKPKILVVSLGFDILKGDPTGTFPLPPSIFRSIGEGLIRTQLPLLLVQEGGYNIRNIKRGCIALFNGLQGEHLG